MFSFLLLALYFNLCYTKASHSYCAYASSFKGHKAHNCKRYFLRRLFVLLTHTIATSEWLLEVSASFIYWIISELYQGNIMSQLNRGYYESFTRAHSIKEYIKVCSCLLTINTWCHCCLWEDNNILKCDMALQYNFPISDFIWHLISWIWQLWKKTKNKLLHGRLQLHVIEELEAVAKFSELRENQRLNM